MAARDTTSIAAVNVSAVDQLIVGFEVSINCRFWVSTEGINRVARFVDDVRDLERPRGQKRHEPVEIRGGKGCEKAIRGGGLVRLLSQLLFGEPCLAVLAHELRNPLAPIRTGLELLRLEGPDAQERIRPVLERQVAHMVRLIDDLLDVSRITSRRIRLERQPTPLGELIDAAVEANRSAIDAARLRLSG